jgi:hypothetical protein
LRLLLLQVLSYAVWNPNRGDRIDCRDDSKVWRVATVLEVRPRKETPATAAAIAAEPTTGLVSAVRSFFASNNQPTTTTSSASTSPSSSASTSFALASADKSAPSAASNLDVLVHFVGCDLFWDRWLPIDSPEIEPHGSHTEGKPTGTLIRTETKTAQLLAMGFAADDIAASENDLEWNASTEEFIAYLIDRQQHQLQTVALGTCNVNSSPFSTHTTISPLVVE